VDKVLQQRLKTVTQVEQAFLATILEELRFSLQFENNQLLGNMSAMKDDLVKVQNHLMHQRHEPELAAVYALISTNILMAIGLLFALAWMRTSIVNYLIRDQMLKMASKTESNKGSYKRDKQMQEEDM
jgi:hypothetical protein